MCADVVSAVQWHPSETLHVTCSGQRLFTMNYSDDDESTDDDTDTDDQAVGTMNAVCSIGNHSTIEVEGLMDSEQHSTLPLDEEHVHDNNFQPLQTPDNYKCDSIVNMITETAKHDATRRQSPFDRSLSLWQVHVYCPNVPCDATLNFP